MKNKAASELGKLSAKKRREQMGEAGYMAWLAEQSMKAAAKRRKKKLSPLTLLSDLLS